MTIPNYQCFMLPVLKFAANNIVNISEIIDTLAIQMNISDDDKKIKTSTGSSLLYAFYSIRKLWKSHIR